MSGSTRGKPGPVAFTQQEIDSLASGRRPATVTRKLGTVGKRAGGAAPRAAKSAKPVPPPINRSELAALRAGRPSPAIRKRLFEGPEPTESAKRQIAVGAVKPHPTEQPPAPRSQKRA